MLQDFRRNALANIANITKKIRKLRISSDQRGKQTLTHSAINDIDLLRSDLILLLNQNFYTQCKIIEKDKLIDKLEQKCNKLESNASLTQRMLQTRYQKQIHCLQYQLFAQKYGEQHHEQQPEVLTKLLQQNEPQNSRYSHSPTPDLQKLLANGQQHFDFKRNQPSTIKKQMEFRQLRTDSCRKATTLNVKAPDPLFEEAPNEEKFDLQLRMELINGVKSQQRSNKSHDPSKQMAKSNDLESQESKVKRRKNRGCSSARRQDNCFHGKKREQLAQLVAQQFKVPLMKEQYFSTDLL